MVIQSRSVEICPQKWTVSTGTCRDGLRAAGRRSLVRVGTGRGQSTGDEQAPVHWPPRCSDPSLASRAPARVQAADDPSVSPLTLRCTRPDFGPLVWGGGELRPFPAPSRLSVY